MSVLCGINYCSNRDSGCISINYYPGVIVMNPLKIVGILIMWTYDMIMLPFVLLVKLIKAIWFAVLVFAILIIIGVNIFG